MQGFCQGASPSVELCFRLAPFSSPVVVKKEPLAWRKRIGVAERCPLAANVALLSPSRLQRSRLSKGRRSAGGSAVRSLSTAGHEGRLLLVCSLQCRFVLHFVKEESITLSARRAPRWRTFLDDNVTPIFRMFFI